MFEHLIHLPAAVLALGAAFSESPDAAIPDASPLREAAMPFFEEHCFDCHDATMKEGGLDLDELSFDPEDPESFARWVLIHDRVRDGEMPPKKKPRPAVDELNRFLDPVAQTLTTLDRERVARSGRATVRRLNRFEYENSLREGLKAPWLLVADRLPEDGTVHFFNKSGERLDVSHVQMTKYLETADHALRLAVQAAAHPTTTNRFYAREEPVMRHYLKYRPGLQTAATRGAIPLLGTTPEPDVIRDTQPFTVGEADPERRELEAMGYVSGTYSATTKYDFTRMDVKIDGRYRIRMKTYTFLAGPNGANGGDDHGLTGGGKAWWRPSRTVAFPGTRREPVTLYALAESGDSRWLTTFDSLPEPTVIEREVFLKRGEDIRPDASRLVRTRPGWKGNPNATTNGVPGFAMNWLELEGPLHETWPPASYQAVFGNLKFEVTDDGTVRALSRNPDRDARRLIGDFMRRMLRDPALDPARAEPFVAIYHEARAMGEDFTDAMYAALATVLCSTDFLYLESAPGPLDRTALASRLSFFLWNGPPDNALLRTRDLQTASQLHRHTERLLNDPRSDRFLNAFLDYWLDLREIKANAPDAQLYPDYYLDDLLTESSILETRRFVRELIDRNLPARNLVDADFTFVNERLARLYGISSLESGQLSKVKLPPGSPRGGLLTQSSVLRVTANGTTTTPVLRGAWVMERLLGVHIPPPPSGIAAIEPDIRGAETIREQLDQHRSVASCAACHEKFDPAGFALESFDVAGGWRERYRAIGEVGERVEGLGKNGHAFEFRLAQPVDSAGELRDGRAFDDVTELKRLLASEERAVARNLMHQLIVYATGSPVSFSDRAEVESMLDLCARTDYGVRTIIHAVTQSGLFRAK